MNKQILPFNSEQVLSLAKNDHSARSSRVMAQSYRWAQLAFNDVLLWGRFLVKDKEDILVSIKRTNLLGQCSCNASLLPCNHVLALLLLAAAEPGSLIEASPPEWAQAVLASKPLLKGLVQKHGLSQAQQAGLELLERWLHDLISLGLEQAKNLPLSSWQVIVQRLHDAHLTDLANEIQSWRLSILKEDWPELSFENVAKLQLLLEGFKRFEFLSDAIQADLLFAIGAKPDFCEEPVRDIWTVLGRTSTSLINQVKVYAWLWGNEHKQFALIELKVSQANGVKSLAPNLVSSSQSREPESQALKLQNNDNKFVVGASFEAQLRFYQGSVRLQAELESFEFTAFRPKVEAFELLSEWHKEQQLLLSQNPWLFSKPALFKGVKLIQHKEDWFFQDKEGVVIPLAKKILAKWHLRAASFGEGATVFGEYRQHFQPLSMLLNDQFVDLKAMRGGSL